MIWSALRRAVGARPLYLPATLAAAIPSAWRSSIKDRSNSATAPITLSMSLPCGVAVSMFRLKMRSATRPLQSLNRVEQMRKRPGQAVDLGDDEYVTLTHVVEGAVQLEALLDRYGADLFGEDLGATRA